MTKVLVIEDHGIVRDGLRYLLGKDPDIEAVHVAATAREGLQMLAEGLRPEILLTDLHLGSMNGIELIKKVTAEYPDIRCILLTMEADPRFLSDAFKSGAQGYILKEAGSDELLFGVHKVAQGRQFICTGLTRRLSECWAKQTTTHQKRSEIKIELSSREAEILQLISDGYTNVEIANRLFTSRRTVEGHRLSLLQKAGVRNTPELIKFAMLNGLLNVTMADERY